VEQEISQAEISKQKTIDLWHEPVVSAWDGHPDAGAEKNSETERWPNK
jgi:hypothetical protein